MFSLNSLIVTDNNLSADEHSGMSAYTMLCLLGGLAVATHALAKFAESHNRLNYTSRFARVVSGSLVMMMRMLHTSKSDLNIGDGKGKLLAFGPHRTGWEAFAVGSMMTGTPPRFFATDAYNSIWLVAYLLSLFNVIPVASKKAEDHEHANKAAGEERPDNSNAVKLGSEALAQGGCVALFPQGNFSRIGEEPPRVYNGAAKLAIKNNVPIHVIRLDGLWSLQNPFIPLFIRNTAIYRAFLSAFHINNLRTHVCCVIDFHLKPENEDLSEEEKINEICAQLYAYYRHTDELSEAQIGSISKEIADKTHLLIWANKVSRDDLTKKLSKLKDEGVKLEAPTLTSLRSLG